MLARISRDMDAEAFRGAFYRGYRRGQVGLGHTIGSLQAEFGVQLIFFSARIS